jgi:hypothetical protein
MEQVKLQERTLGKEKRGISIGKKLFAICHLSLANWKGLTISFPNKQMRNGQ